MRYMALACDYDGTLATAGKVDDQTLDALKRLQESGRRLILVTGRELDDLQQVFAHLDLFERVVAENGGLLFCPTDRSSRLLGHAPPQPFVDELARRNVPISVGRSIVATWKPHDTAVFETIRDLGLELQVIFNKEAVMVLPSGANKATGLAAALKDLHLSEHNVVAVGDAENDHALLRSVECGVAVANAVPMLKDHADLVTNGDHGAGVIELIDRILSNDLSDLESKLARHNLHIGQADDGADLVIPPYGPTILLAGPSRAGKSTLATSLLEQIAEGCYQFCLFDPEGDYEGFPNAVTLGSATTRPEEQAVLDLLEQPSQNAIINLTGVIKEERPKFFETLFPQIMKLRARTGRPHWFVLDEVHHLLPASRRSAGASLPVELHSALMITLEPDRVAEPALKAVTSVLTVGATAGDTIAAFQKSVGEALATAPAIHLPKGEAALWRRRERDLAVFHVRKPEAELRRHRRKYAEGQLEPDEHFRFRGPEEKLNLRAPNLAQFVELAEGVDDETWLFHLKQGDYSRWFRDVIKDAALADRAASIEQERKPDAARTRDEIKAAIAERYTV